jgi:hypothetical protein
MDSQLLDREAFNSFVYCPLDKAVQELKKRQSNKRLEEYVERILPAGIPEIMRGKQNIALFRHIATSNYEISRFVMVADSFPEFQPLILEYTSDKFNDRNECKYYLGKLRFHKGINKKGETMFERVNIIKFNESNNKPISSLFTHWGERLVDFHHRLFNASFPQLKGGVYDLSDWLHKVGPSAKQYYKSFFTLFIKDAILFENFLLDGKEDSFTKEIILPALEDIQKECNVKPLIVALEPTDIEGDQFWLSHPYKVKQLLDEKMGGIKKGIA